MKMGKRSLAEGGFTLIELMTVVVVLAVLAVIAVPAYQEQVRKSRRGQAQAHLVELAQNAERFHTINNTMSASGIPCQPAAGSLPGTELRSTT